VNSQNLSPEALELQPILKHPEQGLVVADRVLKDLYPEFFSCLNFPLLLLDACEDAKSIASVQILYDFFLANKLRRSEIVHVFGGGTICDTAAFAASSYKRGCGYTCIQHLTGNGGCGNRGKTGVNYSGFKNQIGTFYPAERIVIHPDFLKTLARDEIRQGIAEMLKLAILFPEIPIPDSCEDLPHAEDILRHALYKMSICQIDPYDGSERMLLNFGHSFGHALETKSEYQIRHGDAVVMGMIMACDLSLQMGFISRERHAELRNILSGYEFPAAVLAYVKNLDMDELLVIMEQDKKSGSAMRLILPVGKEIKLVEFSE
jgi:3-dehydroquinate synthase